MRKSCLFCVSKHLSQAIVLTTEAVLGYPMHLWIAVGHLAEAECEACSKYPDLAKEIRKVRLSLMGQKGTFRHESLMELLQSARNTAQAQNGTSEELRIQGILNVGLKHEEINNLPKM